MKGESYMGVRAFRIAFLVVFFCFAGTAFAAGPQFMPGFPLRAGANVMLMWMPFPGALSYNVYRSDTTGGPYEKLANAPANNYMDLNVSADKSLYYVVKAVIGGKEGDASPEVVLKGIEAMKTPKFGGHLVTPDNKISVRWEANPQAAFYNLYRSETEKGDFKLLTSVQDVKYTDANVTVGKTYYYKVTAVNSSNNESPKAEKPYAANAAQQVDTEEKAVTLVKREVEEVGTYDVDGQIILRTPKDIAVGSDGSFYVVDGRGYVQHVSKEFTYIKAMGERPADFKANWGFPEGVFYDSKAKELYIAFTDGVAVRIFDGEGKLVRGISPAKPNPDTTSKLDWSPAPVDMAIGADGILWVVDGGYYQLIGYNGKGEEVKRISLPREHKDRKPGDANLVAPSFVAVNPKNGNIYVLEVGMQRVSVFDKGGKFLFHMGGRGALAGKFLLPAGLAVDEDGVAYVGDRNLDRIQTFDEKGAYLATLVNPKKKTPEKQIQVAPGALGLAVRDGIIYYSDIAGEKVVAYKNIKNIK
jgi:sugar lactone lactonase YvrE